MILSELPPSFPIHLGFVLAPRLPRFYIKQGFPEHFNSTRSLRPWKVVLLLWRLKSESFASSLVFFLSFFLPFSCVVAASYRDSESWKRQILITCAVTPRERCV
ncbi:hypothetical protein BT93_H0727 [Corymbia citriodora subsp. variegata]|nr:hypothetical protein BT93_H0727 [Corymbia citriodora subsp. variegata]